MDQSDLTEVFSAFDPVKSFDVDGNPLGEAYVLTAANIPFNVHRGDADAQQQVLLIGAAADQAASAFTLTSYKSKLKHLTVLVNAEGEAWTIQGRPVVRNRFPETAHVKCLLIRLSEQRDGLPTITP